MPARREKRFTRTPRLHSAKQWVVTCRDDNLVRRYKKRYGVSDICAVLELRMLGVDLPDARLEQARRDEQSRAAEKARRKRRRTAPSRSGGSGGHGELDALFAFIAGYTEGGAPYGITWEETEADDEQAGSPVARPGSRARHGCPAPRVNRAPVLDDDESLPF